MSDERRDKPMPASLKDALDDAFGDAQHEEREQLGRVWELLGTYPPRDGAEPAGEDPYVELEEAWFDLKGRLDAAQRAESARWRRRLRSATTQDRSPRYGRRRRRGAAALAGIAAVATVLFGAWLLLNPVTVTVPPGVQHTLTLPDGSTIDLNSASELQYARLFKARAAVGLKRRVILRGEAFFSIVPDDAAFVVETADARIEVLGTSFNVRIRPGRDDAGTEVVLAEGRIRLQAVLDPGRSVILSDAGTSAVVSGAGAVRTTRAEETASLEHLLAWRNHGFAAVDRPLGEILDEVERRFALRIEPRDGIDPTEPMSLFYLRGGTADQILRDICLAEECTYRATSRGFALAQRDRAL